MARKPTACTIGVHPCPSVVILRGLLRAAASWRSLLLAAVLHVLPAPALGDDVTENVAGAKGLDQALQRLHAPLRETEPLSPQEQLEQFRTREGLTVDLIASEPQVRQPLYLTFDERGRMWVVQYIQYPFPAGLKVVEYDQYIRAKFDKVPPPPPKHFRGNDIISILEDSDGDGSFETSKTFVEGLSIATAALPGRGGVWVLNPPYLLFYPDKDRDDVPDGEPVVHLSGFGLQDTHAVASSLTWGPDGWIYGAHGSTCTSRVRVEIQSSNHEIRDKRNAENAGSEAGGDVSSPRAILANPQSEIRNPQSSPTTDFLGQCIWRYHPTRHVFEIFAEGGGNTFGVEFDDFGRVYSGTNWGNFRGLHYVQGGYYIKGWGKHGPLTNPYAFGFFDHMPHQGNADRLTHTFVVYGGGLFGDTLQGAIIGPNSLQSRVDVTRLVPSGSTFQTIEDETDLLTCDDGWFRPVDLKVGPDGALYIADFYEQRISHVDPRDNWNRQTGRIWRVRPSDHAAAGTVTDFRKASSQELLDVLDNDNRLHRATTRRILGDRKDDSVVPALRSRLKSSAGRDALEALWALHEVGGFDESAAIEAVIHAEPMVRAWSLRLLGDQKRAMPSAVLARLLELAEHEANPEVRSQLASTAKRLPGEQSLPILDRMVRRAANASDPHIPLLLWWAIEDKAVSHREQVLAMFTSAEMWQQPLARDVIMQRLARRYAADLTPDNQDALVRLMTAVPGDAERAILLGGVREAFEGREIRGLTPELSAVLATSNDPEIAIRAGDPAAIAAAMKRIAEGEGDDATKEQRIRLIELLGQAARAEAAPTLLSIAETSESHSVRRAALAALARFDAPQLGERIIQVYPKLPTDQDVRPTAIWALASRPQWAASLLKAIEAGAIPKADIPADQLDRIRGFDEPALHALADRLFGPVQKPTSEEKRAEADRVKAVVLAGPAGDPAAGEALFTARCAACHTLRGQGANVGPDLTGYERDNVDYMSFNIVDPSASVREEFTNFAIRTKSGQAFVGLIAARDANQITLVDTAGQRSVIAKTDIDREKALETSPMPEGLLDGLTDEEMRNLFAYLAAKE